MANAKKTTKKRRTDIIREMEEDTTYDMSNKRHQNDLLNGKKNGREEQLQDELRRQFIQRKKAAALLKFEDAITNTVKE